MSVAVSARSSGDATVVSVVGEINSSTSGSLQRKLLEHITGEGDVLIDLAGVDYVSSAGLRALLLVYRQAQRVGARIRLTGLSEEVRFVMSATGFLNFFGVDEPAGGELSERP